MARAETQKGLLLLCSLLAPIAGCNAPPVVPSTAPASIASASPSPAAREASAPLVRVEASAGRAINSFRPLRALGAGIDRLSPGSVDALYVTPILNQVLSAGWGSVTYRLNTELHVEAWHWNPKGKWSDPSGRGYFTGDAEPGDPIRHSYGYPLPLRGYTRNEGTENEGYSRLTDGDPKSYWKSNPYLASIFTGESESQYPQWVVIDLGEAK